MDHEVMEGEDYVDWKGKSAHPNKHGGIKGAAIACFVEILENMVFLSCLTNFVSYFLSWNYPPAQASIMLTNFSGTAFLCTIFGGFISDSFVTRCWTFIIFVTLELLGLITLRIQAGTVHIAEKEKPTHSEEVVLFLGMYAIAVGVGGVKATLQAHGADQLDRSNKRHISSFFNWFFFCLCTGGLLASTFMVYIQENLSWKAAFSFNIGAMSLGLILFASGFPIYRNKRPTGSPLSRIFKVLLCTARNWKESSLYQNGLDAGSRLKLRFLNKAMVKNEVTLAQVEETRIFLRLLPIFASTIMMNCCLAQLQTFSVQQGRAMNKRLINDFEIPTASLTAIPLVFILSSICLYERFANMFVKKQNQNQNQNQTEKKNSFLQPLRRVGVGLALASGSMAIAAIVEVKRRENGKQGHQISVFWLAWQYLLLGVSDTLALGGMLEFFYSEASSSMRSMSTALAWCSTALGYFLSSLLVKISNAISGRGNHHAWLGDKNMNNNRLELFYTLLCVLNTLNLLNYVYWAKRY